MAFVRAGAIVPPDAVEAARGDSHARHQAIKPSSHQRQPISRLSRAGRQLSSAPSLVYIQRLVLLSAFVRTATVCQEPGSELRQLSNQPTCSITGTGSFSEDKRRDTTANPQHSTAQTRHGNQDMGRGGLAESQDSRNCHPANPGLPFTVWTLMPFPMELRYPALPFLPVP
ncbi:hypothetical protein DL98DRAFT_573983 [Cadophora sp. DSE1049]|nr:hypothetical protein DL98DRAFT_573983 [Cadophora sp. DSE1049]